ncbi:MAG: acylneuraminate cytidylyltransferase family protein [Phycisphaerae bacterium]|nr:acylneuraminate cytidylyltransferase family protein [Phycisphaerae bacterium]
MSRAIAIILARAGSKGLPGKNARPVAGKPCVQWTIEAARASRRVGRIVLSTDDAGLAALAAGLGVECVDRPPSLAGDAARVDDAARHALSIVAPGAPPGRPIVILYANVPVRPAGLIDRAVDLLVTSACDSVQSYARVGKHHPWWTARVDAEGRVRAWEGDVLNHGVFRRQDLPPAFVPDGGVIALTARALCLEVPGAGDGPHAFFGVDRRGIETGEDEVIDIDGPVDLLVADAVLRTRARIPA